MHVAGKGELTKVISRGAISHCSNTILWGLGCEALCEIRGEISIVDREAVAAYFGPRQSYDKVES